ncbi:MAG: 16S rRNA (cytosine(1402)-N(4))-methyltransferase RsmH [Gammaproteobacteria bacterium]
MAREAHLPVMPAEVLEALRPEGNGVFIDGTFGRGGHAQLILERLGSAGRVIGIDQDPEAVAEGERLASEDKRFVIERGSFEMLARVARKHDCLGRVAGILLDLGVSSPQLDEPLRGFSFIQDGPLDMRMDPDRGPSAADWLNTAPEREIADVLWRYGEERYSRRIARNVVQARTTTPLTRTRQLADLIRRSVPRPDPHKHPATRSFQAIRIFINAELQALEATLPQALEVLAIGGRLAVISFHSLEDRIVKRFMRDASRPPQAPRGLPVPQAAEVVPLRLCGKARRASEDEIARNPRARSAVLRVAERAA